METYCIDCHAAPHMSQGRLKKPKGGLSLDSAAAIMRGGINGPAVVPGKPDESTFYVFTTLDADDDDVMPNKGDLLSPEQQEVLRIWIAEGANFGNWTGAKEPLTQEPSAGIPWTIPVHPADALGENMKSLGSLNPNAFPFATITPVSDRNSLLRIEYISSRSKVTDKEVARLGDIRTHITDLDLSGTRITDRSLGIAGACPRLTKLDLHGTKIGDAGITQLKNLNTLRSLNLYGTRVTDKSLPVLAGLKNLESLYLWDTGITSSGANRLRKALPSTRIRYEGTLPLPPPEPEPEDENRRGRKGARK